MGEVILVMSMYDAKRQFGENQRLFGNSTTEPEKFNLYAGLYNLAQAIEEMQSDLHKIKEELHQVKGRV